jgi:hypothetical protein
VKRPVLTSITCVAAVLLAGLALVTLSAGAGPPDRVWAFVPDPVWSEDPPAHVALTRGGTALPKTVWTAVVPTQSDGRERVVVVRQPSPLWRRFVAIFGRAAAGEFYIAVDEGRAAQGGRWHECARQDTTGH